MNHEVISHRDSFDLLISKLLKGKPFTFTRFGDGDYIIMYPDKLNKIVGSSNQFKVTKNLQREIAECHNIQHENFLIGSILNDRSAYAMKGFNTRVNQNKLPSLIEHEELLAMSCLQEMLLVDPEKFLEFPREMQKTSTMLVGSYNHDNLSKIFGDVDIFIEVPQRNCYSSIEAWYNRILENKHKVGKIVLAAGFSSRVIAKRLWQSEDIIIDVGSLGDMFVLDKVDIPLRTHIQRGRKHINENVSRVLSSL